jgi:hypothetical protein
MASFFKLLHLNRTLPTATPAPSQPLALVCALVSNKPTDYLAGGCYHDNASSYNVTNQLQLIYDVVPLASPISLDGISNGVRLTHSCKFRCLPPANNLNEGYYSPNIKFTLFSCGHLQRKGGIYASTNSTSRLGINLYYPDGSQTTTRSRRQPHF